MLSETGDDHIIK